MFFFCLNIIFYTGGDLTGTFFLLIFFFKKQRWKTREKNKANKVEK